MNILEKRKMLFETIDIIKMSLEMLGGKTFNEKDYSYIINGKYSVSFKINIWSYMEVQFDLFSNCIFIKTCYVKYEAFYLKKLYDSINSTPKNIIRIEYFNHVNVEIRHIFKISKANIQRVYDIFTVMIRL